VASSRWALFCAIASSLLTSSCLWWSREPVELVRTVRTSKSTEQLKRVTYSLSDLEPERADPELLEKVAAQARSLFSRANFAGEVIRCDLDPHEPGPNQTHLAIAVLHRQQDPPDVWTKLSVITLLALPTYDSTYDAIELRVVREGRPDLVVRREVVSQRVYWLPLLPFSALEYVFKPVAFPGYLLLPSALDAARREGAIP